MTPRMPGRRTRLEFVAKQPRQSASGSKRMSDFNIPRAGVSLGLSFSLVSVKQSTLLCDSRVQKYLYYMQPHINRCSLRLWRR